MAVADRRMEVRTKCALVTARGENQVLYLRNIQQHDINFGIGPAGTGKTWLAVASAVQALESGRVSGLFWFDRLSKPANVSGFCRVIWHRKFIPICVHFMMACMK